MATITKFYLRDAASPNTGTMPSNSPGAIEGIGTQGDATGAATARDAIDVIGASNPDIESTITSNADVNTQVWGHRRFVSRPLAAQQVANGSRNWTFSYARSESNLNHNQFVKCALYAWRPSTGAQVGAIIATMAGNEPTVAGTEQTESVTSLENQAVSILDADILVFDVYTRFTQVMSTAYTESFAYNGTTEASTTACASFVLSPIALTLASTAAVSDTPQTYMDKRLTSRRRVIRVVQ